MGKRKTAKKQMKKEKPKLMSKFDCPFCNHGGSIKISMMRKAKLAQVKCTVCNVSYETKITEPIDIYSEWIDECEKVNNDDPAQNAPKPSRGRASNNRNDEDDDEPEEEENDEDDD